MPSEQLQQNQYFAYIFDVTTAGTGLSGKKDGSDELAAVRVAARSRAARKCSLAACFCMFKEENDLAFVVELC